MSTRLPVKTTSRLVYYRYSDGKLITPAPTPSYQTYVDSYSGSDVVGYKEKIKKHHNASSDYTMKLPRHYRAKTSTLFRDTSIPPKLVAGEYESFFGYTPPTNIPTDSVVDDQAVRAIKRKLSTAQDAFNSLVPLAEIKETRALVSSVANATTGVLKSFIDLKKGKFTASKPREVYKRASDAWLQFAFGVSPTISDVNSLLSSIDSYLNRANFTKSFRGSAEKRWVQDLTQSSLYQLGYTWTPQVSVVHHLKYTYSAGVRFDLRNANNYGVGDHFGLNFGSLVEAAWEVIPYSWILDYFTTCGEYFSDAFDAPPGNTFYVNKAILYKAIGESKVKGYTLAAGTPIYIRHEPMRIDFTGYSRTGYSTLPYRSCRFKTFDEIGHNSINKLLNLNALFGSKAAYR